MMFSFTDRNPEWVYIFIPPQIRLDATDYAKEHAVPGHSFAGRDKTFTDILLDCVCGWAFSKWCTQRGIWHECNFTDTNDADVIVEDKENGLQSFVISSRIANGGIDPSREGVRISNWQLEKESDTVDWYISASFDSGSVVFHGVTGKDCIQYGEYTWDLRPLIYDCPADDMVGTMEILRNGCRKTKEKQEIFGGLFKEE